MSDQMSLFIVTIALSLGLVSLSITSWRQTRWLSRLSQRVLDLEYPEQAKVRKKP